jgi:hypothetical protein
MALNMDKMRAKLNNLKSGGRGNFWKPQEGKQDIRILPTEDGDPFKVFYFHYNVGNEAFLCPHRNFGEDCAVCSFVKSLFNEGDDDSSETAKKMMAKTRYFSPILVRGEEDRGVRIWGYSKTVYENLIETVLDPEYGDITDMEEGRDITLTYGKVAGKLFPETKLKYKLSTSPLCKDFADDECEKLLESVPDFNDIHPVKTSAEVKLILDATLGGSSDSNQPLEVSSVDKAFEELA